MEWSGGRGLKRPYAEQGSYDFVDTGGRPAPLVTIPDFLPTPDMASKFPHLTSAVYPSAVPGALYNGAGFADCLLAPPSYLPRSGLLAGMPAFPQASESHLSRFNKPLGNDMLPREEFLSRRSEIALQHQLAPVERYEGHLVGLREYAPEGAVLRRDRYAELSARSGLSLRRPFLSPRRDRRRYSPPRRARSPPRSSRPRKRTRRKDRKTEKGALAIDKSKGSEFKKKEAPSKGAELKKEDMAKDDRSKGAETGAEVKRDVAAKGDESKGPETEKQDVAAEAVKDESKAAEVKEDEAKGDESKGAETEKEDTAGTSKTAEDVKTENPTVEKPVAGMIFGCNDVTEKMCRRLRIFGLPASQKDGVLRVVPGTKLFLFNFTSKELSGVYEATCNGAMDIVSDAFKGHGSFPAQVRTRRVKKAANLPLRKFKEAMKENFYSYSKFHYELTASQVEKLQEMFASKVK